MSGAEMAALLKKKAFDECTLSPKVQQGVNGNVWCAADSSPSCRTGL
jgi:hypothetical protein